MHKEQTNADKVYEVKAPAHHVIWAKGYRSNVHAQTNAGKVYIIKLQAITVSEQIENASVCMRKQKQVKFM